MRSAFGGVNHAWCRRCSQQFALLMLLCSVVPCSLVWLRAIGEPSAFGVRAARWNILLLVFTLCSQIHILTSYLPSTHYCLSSCCLPPFERCSILTFSSRVALRPFYEVRPKRAQVGRPTMLRSKSKVTLIVTSPHSNRDLSSFSVFQGQEFGRWYLSARRVQRQKP